MSTKLSEVIEAFHDYGICITTKTITIDGEIDDDLADRTLANLHILDQMAGDITILLSSPGGCVSAGFKIYDAIRAAKNHVRIISYGEVASMATIVFQAADTGRRFMTPNSYLMLHEGEGERGGSEKTMAAWRKLHEWQFKNMMNVYWTKVKEKKPRAKKHVFENKVLTSDWILFPKEAIEQGLCDKIIESY